MNQDLNRLNKARKKKKNTSAPLTKKSIYASDAGISHIRSVFRLFSLLVHKASYAWKNRHREQAVTNSSTLLPRMDVPKCLSCHVPTL